MLPFRPHGLSNATGGVWEFLIPNSSFLILCGAALPRRGKLPRCDYLSFEHIR